MKKVIIYTTKDEVISLHLVNSIVTDPKFENCKIDIKLSNPSFKENKDPFSYHFFWIN